MRRASVVRVSRGKKLNIYREQKVQGKVVGLPQAKNANIRSPPK